MRNKIRSMVLILLTFALIISGSGCSDSTDPYERAMKRYEKYADVENGEDLLFKDLEQLSPDELIEEANAIMATGAEAGSCMHHAIMLRQKMDEMSFDYLLENAAEKANCTDIRYTLLHIYADKQEKTAVIRKGLRS